MTKILGKPVINEAYKCIYLYKLLGLFPVTWKWRALLFLVVALKHMHTGPLRRLAAPLQLAQLASNKTCCRPFAGYLFGVKAVMGAL